MHSALELVSTVANLFPLPTVYLHVREELDSPNGSPLGVARAIGADPAMTASILRLVNSAFYGFGRQIDNIQRAVTVLGLQQVHDLVLAISVSTAFSGLKPLYLDLPEFWRGSVLRGLAAREIGRVHGLLGAERLFVMGLLSDIGHLVLYQTVPELAHAANTSASRGDAPLIQCERQLVGCDHAEIGACLLSQWNLPEAFVKVVGAQFEPRLAADHAFESAIVHLAAQIAHADRTNEASAQAAARIDPAVWTMLDMKPDNFRTIRECAELELAAYVTLLLPPNAGAPHAEERADGPTKG